MMSWELFICLRIKIQPKKERCNQSTSKSFTKRHTTQTTIALPKSRPRTSRLQPFTLHGRCALHECARCAWHGGRAARPPRARLGGTSPSHWSPEEHRGRRKGDGYGSPKVSNRSGVSFRHQKRGGATASSMVRESTTRCTHPKSDGEPIFTCQSFSVVHPKIPSKA